MKYTIEKYEVGNIIFTERNLPVLSPGSQIELLTEEQLALQPTGTVLYDIFGRKRVVGFFKFDYDTRCGFTAYGRLVENPNKPRDLMEVMTEMWANQRKDASV